MGHPYAVSVRQSDLAPASRWPISFLRKVVYTTLGVADCRGPVELSLTMTSDAKIHQLNLDYRGIDKPTDVLSFALEEGPPMALPADMPRQLGDIVVSLETTLRQAQEYANQPQAEVAWVICHGVLHLLGYDHQKPDEFERMRSQEQKVLTQLGLSRP